jgi:hypothetical protein
MRNFDDLYPEDRSFQLGGEMFHWRPVQWRIYGDWVDAAVEEDRAATASAEDGVPLQLVLTFEKVIDRILLFLDPDEKDLFLATVNDADKNVTIMQLNELSTWLLEVQTDRSPTTASTPSANGPGTPEAISAAG